MVDGSVRVFVAGQDGTKRSRRLAAGDFGSSRPGWFRPDFDWSDAQG